MEKQFALVTGSGSGIGYAFAEALAKRGHHVIMVSLPGEELPAKAEQLAQKYKVQTRAIEVDLCDPATCQRIFEELKSRGYVVDILINNAGIGSNARFADFQSEFYHRQITLNTIVPVTLCRLFLPEMSKLKKAYILNMASMAAFFHMPHKEVYSATKSFIYSFSRSLQLSLIGTPVSLTVICPGGVESNERLQKLHEQLKGLPKRAVMMPEAVAEESLDALFSGKKYHVPGRINRLLLRLDKIVPTFMKTAFIRKEMERQENLRASAAGTLHTG
jgi:short-subunit dehydrogenase